MVTSIRGRLSPSTVLPPIYRNPAPLSLPLSPITVRPSTGCRAPYALLSLLLYVVYCIEMLHSYVIPNQSSYISLLVSYVVFTLSASIFDHLSSYFVSPTLSILSVYYLCKHRHNQSVISR